jgi:hypothetical protein
MALEFTTSYVKDATDLLRFYKKLGEGAMAQVADEKLYTMLDDESNSIAILVKHMMGNMQSRWTDFLTSDGEKPNRNRDGEFVEPPPTRAALMECWENGWRCIFSALEPLVDADLTRVVTIRSERHSVMQAINRQLGHYAYHCGQIVLLAKYLRGDSWKTLSVPRGKSQAWNQKVLEGNASQR